MTTAQLTHIVGGERVECGPTQHDVSPSNTDDLVAEWGAADAALAEQLDDALLGVTDRAQSVAESACGLEVGDRIEWVAGQAALR